METAFVAVNTQLGQESDVVKAIRKLKGTKEAYKLYGVYDLLVIVEAETIGILKERLLKIHRLKDVRATLDMFIQKSSEPYVFTIDQGHI